MTFLWLSIFCSTGIYFLFKIREKYKANLTGIIIINYFIATILGFFTSSESNKIQTILQSNWLTIAIIIGFLFVIMFFLIGLSTQKAGMAVTSIATRMSMVFPILFSIFLFDEAIYLSKIIKIVLTLIAVTLAIYHKPEKNIKLGFVFLPIILFVGSGSVDTLVKIAQHLYVPDNEIQLFSSALFGISFLASIIFNFIKKPGVKIFSKNSLLIGFSLGPVNFGSLFFLIKALNRSGLASSMVFGINNLAIVCFSLLIGFIIFKEKLSKLNWMGIILSIFCILLLINEG